MLNGAGPTGGQYVVSRGGKRDGENLWDSRDVPVSSTFMRSAAKRWPSVRTSDNGAVFLPATSEAKTVSKIARLMYFRSWDWVVGASIPEAEMYDVVC